MQVRKDNCTAVHSAVSEGAHSAARSAGTWQRIHTRHVQFAVLAIVDFAALQEVSDSAILSTKLYLKNLQWVHTAHQLQVFSVAARGSRSSS